MCTFCQKCTPHQNGPTGSFMAWDGGRGISHNRISRPPPQFFSKMCTFVKMYTPSKRPKLNFYGQSCMYFVRNCIYKHHMGRSRFLRRIQVCYCTGYLGIRYPLSHSPLLLSTLQDLWSFYMRYSNRRCRLLRYCRNGCKYSSAFELGTANAFSP